MTGVAGQAAGPGGPRKRRRNCRREHHRGKVFFPSPESGVSGPFVRVVDARSRARMCQKVPPPRRVRWADTCLSTGIRGEGFGKAWQSHWSSSAKVRIGDRKVGGGGRIADLTNAEPFAQFARRNELRSRGRRRSGRWLWKGRRARGVERDVAFD